MRQSMNNGTAAAHTKVAQRVSTNSQGVEEQVDWLEPPRQRASSPVDAKYLFGLPSLRRAVAYSLSLADMDPKEAYQPLGMDKATWSRITSGGQEVPASLLKPLRVLTGNYAPLRWLAYTEGFELIPLKSELERQLDEERDARAEVERENAVLRSLLTGKRP
jgi:hypothetical protein